jgi:uncharacterized membrane protein
MTAIALNLRTGRTFVGWHAAAFYVAILSASAPFWPFAWHLGLHVAGAAMLIGNALVMAVWLSVAGFAGGDQAKRRAARAVNLGDVWFTVPGVLLILLNGLAMIGERYGGVAAFTTVPWIGGGIVLLTVTGVVWATRLVPAQLALHRLADVNGPIDAGRFRRSLVGWSVWGVIATVTPLIAVFLMTTKPSL